MCFLFKLSSIFLLAGAFAGPVEYGPAYGVIGENPLGNLNDLQTLQDESSLNALTMPQIQTNGLISKKGVLCPQSVLLFKGREDVKFVLYNENWPFGADISQDLGAGKLIPNTPIKFLIHGFLNGGNSVMIQTIKDAYMQTDDGNYNVIVVDWTKGSGTWLSNYYNCLITQRVVPKVGEAVASYISDLITKQNVNLLYVNVIGHSLGAQVAGRAGKNLIQMGYKLPIIVGLDPALPEFQYRPETERLAPTDAEYVEVIHSNPGDLGFEIPLGDADFYPNYGQERRNRQPGCITPACCHARSFQFFAETIINPTAFEAIQCQSFEALKAGQCLGQRRGQNVYMGGPDMRTGKARGVFKVETNRSAPYGRNSRTY